MGLSRGSVARKRCIQARFARFGAGPVSTGDWIFLEGNRTQASYSRRNSAKAAIGTLHALISGRRLVRDCPFL